ncbi:hypothetical protein K470DRAFT_267595 [Piedraia hortae CBS 480.64]|uniref:Uncharacterized protein n=1 Tax=Piedraia hortae CBS 480.64 TaxID=1314780 RepID=A0A6A7CC98_9PEZI|nr:hypothetical protein K470DRAFT_267595 [Piedraia hortae CBS 480.64]
MIRMTRSKAAQVAKDGEQLSKELNGNHFPDDLKDDQERETPMMQSSGGSERKPLGEISPNGEEKDNVSAKAVDDKSFPVVDDDAGVNNSLVTDNPDRSPPSGGKPYLPDIVQKLRKDTGTPGKRSTSNKENVSPFAATTTPAGTPLAAQVPVTGSASGESVRGNGLPATDEHLASDSAQDDGNVGSRLPDEQESYTPKSTPNKAVAATAITPPKSAAPAASTSGKSKKPVPVVKPTKASQARISLAHPTKDGNHVNGNAAKPRPSSVHLARGSSIAPRVSTLPSLPEKFNPNSKVEIPHSKPRPISISFPTPPPPPKSSKPPTKSNFQLPGEAVAAKLKAAREARLLAVQEEEKDKKTFKARPVPKSLSRAPTVKGTAKSRARESILAGGSSGPLDQTAKRAVSDKAKINAAPRARAASAASATKGSVIEEEPGPKKATGKEILARPAIELRAARSEKEKKEAAVKLARAEAAERSRLLSREWAEKQKQKLMGKKGRDASHGSQIGA